MPICGEYSKKVLNILLVQQVLHCKLLNLSMGSTPDIGINCLTC